METLGTLETVKIKTDNEFGYRWENVKDVTPEMKLYVEGDEAEEKPVVTPAKKRPAAKG
jgi:hypothetical protein